MDSFALAGAVLLGFSLEVKFYEQISCLSESVISKTCLSLLTTSSLSYTLAHLCQFKLEQRR
jgi:hypothetical protein